jgi:hypothetical protein
VSPVRYEHHLYIESKAIPVTGNGGRQGYEILGIAHCLRNRIKDGGCQPYASAALYSRETFFLLLVHITVTG